ncbi:MAG: DUF983 domain-containing protein [Chryseolinea sp.]
MKERSAITGIMSMRCPKCREGKMFPVHTLYSGRFMKMNDHCSCCGQSFEPEPAYYFGAMFISYALNAGYFIGLWIVLLILMDNIPDALMIGGTVALVVGLLPITFRLSRVLWIYIFVRYQGPAECKTEAVHIR